LWPYRAGIALRTGGAFLAGFALWALRTLRPSAETSAAAPSIKIHFLPPKIYFNIFIAGFVMFA